MAENVHESIHGEETFNNKNGLHGNDYAENKSVTVSENIGKKRFLCKDACTVRRNEKTVSQGSLNLRDVSSNEKPTTNGFRNVIFCNTGTLP